MTEQPKKTLTYYAMQYGIFMGIYLLILFLFSVGSRYASIFSTLSIVMIVATPAALYLVMSDFVRQRGGCKFGSLWLFGIFVFFFASLISGLGEYIYCQYIAPDFLSSLFAAMLEALGSMDELSPETADFIEMMRSGYEQGGTPTAIEWVVQMIWFKVFVGSLLSIFVALFV
ncbi:MAG: DUF4199 domain-containing protein, partial [Porphyromonadaceae bacterium]|nr:DUF4199 domain-containing protein [Porphyromonadaceae bacterium]